MEFSSFTVEALTRKRPVTTKADTNDKTLPSSHSQLQRHLNARDLIFYGVGCSVGAGIYSLVGIGARLAGPSIALSFCVAGVACCFTSLAYSEFASRIPASGSAYTFVYVTFGELCGWLVGWCLTLGYAVSAAVVARSWADYLVGFVSGYYFWDVADLGFLTKYPIPLFGDDYTCCPLSMVIITVCTLILVLGVKESARFNTIMTLLNLSVLCFVLISGLGAVDYRNLTPVFPHGVSAMAQGSGLVFFAYLGFDMVSCLSEEVQNPERNMPIGIIGSLAVSMSLYFAIALVVVGMAPPLVLGEDTPIVNALLSNACCNHEDQLLEGAHGTCLSYDLCDPILNRILFVGSRVVSFGAIFGLTTATFTCLMGQPRIFYSMAKDGLLFKIYKRVNPTTGVPTVGTILTGVCTALVACFIDLESLANTISLGTLLVFTLVNAGVILLRVQPSIGEVTNEEMTSQRAVESSPLIVRDIKAASVARSLGLVGVKSEEIRLSVRNSFRNRNSPIPSATGNKPIWLLLLFTATALATTVVLSNELSPWIAFVCPFLLSYSAMKLISLPQIPPPETFACPWVPIVPLLGIACNAYMMGSMSLKTWSLIAAWLALGLVFYLGYGIHHSELRPAVPAPKPIDVKRALIQPTQRQDYGGLVSSTVAPD